MGTTPKYTPFASRAFSSTSAKQAARRSSTSVKSRKPKLTGFFTFSTTSCCKNTQEMWVSRTSLATLARSCLSSPTTESSRHDHSHLHSARLSRRSAQRLVGDDLAGSHFDFRRGYPSSDL